MWGELVSFLAELTISVITAVVVIRFSLKRFYSQKWWEKKAETYSEILKSLSDVKIYSQGHMNDIIGIPADANRKLQTDHSTKAYNSIERIVHTGPFIISEEAVGELSGLLTELEGAREKETSYEQAEAEFVALDKSIEKILEYARWDLRRGREKPERRWWEWSIIRKFQKSEI